MGTRPRRATGVGNSRPSANEAFSGAELEQVSGVPGAKFCHKARFIAAASSREAIIKMAELAVDEARRLEPTGDAQEGADARS